jgi:hypothetical protein
MTIALAGRAVRIFDIDQTSLRTGLPLHAFRLSGAYFGDNNDINGLDAEDHERQLNGVELDHREADYREHPQSALKRRSRV